MAESEGGPVTQDDRILKITTPFDDNYLLIQSIDLTEEISKLPFAECVVLHDEKSEGVEPTILDVQKILGQEVAVEFARPDGSSRFYHGIVNSCTQLDRDRRFTYYRLTVVPSFWLLTQNQKSRIFQHVTVPQILEQVFSELPFELQLGTVEWKPRNYTVQYRESDFDFASRLMEEEGIFYFFKYDIDAHKMIICVDTRSHEKCETKYEIAYRLKDQEGHVSYIDDFEVNYHLQTGLVTLWDHTHQKPKDNFEVSHPTRFTFGKNAEAEHYLFPSGSIRKYDVIDAGQGERGSELQLMSDDIKRNAELMQQAIDARHRNVRGISNCCALVSGYRFKLAFHPTKEFNSEYVLTRVVHRAVQSPLYYSDMPEGGYSNSFECMTWGEGATPFRPQRSTPKPMILTSQTATVVGKKGEEIYTDKYGRVKVQFHWDREGEFSEGSSCWARVAQHWSGNRWGSMFIPRVGMEVLVHFLEGDPDQPIITGCVYNNDAMPAYELPENKTLSGIKTDSTKGGGGFNELRFDDKKGEEQVFIHGQYDMDVRIQNDRREWTGHDQHLWVVRDQFEMAENDLHQTVKNDHLEHIKRDRHLKVGTGITHKEAKEVTGSQSLKVGLDQGIKIGGNKSEEVTGSMYLKGMNVVVEGMTQLSLKVGGNFIDINPGGIFIQGTMVMINSGGAAGSGMANQLVAPTAPTEPKKAAEAEPGKKMELMERSRKKKETESSKEDPKKKSWIKLKLVDEAGKPVPGERFRIKTSDGKYRTGSLDHKGQAHIKGIEPGSCEVTFPNLDKDAWEDA
jgi:type VI secretion system secreted protein VgrG